MDVNGPDSLSGWVEGGDGLLIYWDEEEDRWTGYGVTFISI